MSLQGRLLVGKFPECSFVNLFFLHFSGKKGKGKKFKWIKFGTNVDLSDERK